MRREDHTTARKGFTLVELLITIAVLTILLTMAVSTFRGLDEKYDVETETKQLYTDLMEARGRAVQRYRVHFVRLSGNGYATYEDTFTAPDGNGIWDSASDNMVARAATQHAIVAALTGGVSEFEFDRNGIASVSGSIRFSSTANPDYDCITILPTRIKMGQYAGGSCVEK
jgi:prepilin-type N-terminal cleavage/methylation domain-containing protein